MEQFVVRNGFKAETIADLKGAKLLSAPGPANLNTAKAILARNGLKDGDYTIDQSTWATRQCLTAGTFAVGIPLEPNASMMIKAGVARSLEAGVISKYILGDERPTLCGGCAMTSDFIAKRPKWQNVLRGVEQGHRFHQQNPDEARKYLARNTFTPTRRRYGFDAGICHGGDMSARQIGDLQQLADFGNSIGVVPEKLDVTKVCRNSESARRGRSTASCESRIGGQGSRFGAAHGAPCHHPRAEQAFFPTPRSTTISISIFRAAS